MNKTIHLKEYKQIVEKLNIARKQAGITQKEAALKLKKPQSYISKVEAGEQRIDIIELKEFSNIYKKSISFFL